MAPNDVPTLTDPNHIFSGLNDRQKQAVGAPRSGRLQIVAGPGTGKTTVLVSRVAYLLLVEKVRPERLMVTTFTKKAAAEMTARLQVKLAGSGIDPEKVLMGTFHSLCYRIIKRYGHKVGIGDYTIADERDSLQLIQEAVGAVEGAYDFLEDDTKTFKNNKDAYDCAKIKKTISSLKSRAMRPESYTARKSGHNRFISAVYAEYQTRLSAHRFLDFDDCLVECYLLIQKLPVLNFVEHVLVDEFQDTNEIQLQLMYAFARGHPSEESLQNNVTVVGDPDQSIYAFRDAQAVNFEKMRSRYPDCAVIALDQNYRSTLDILDFSESMMGQQPQRQKKRLISQIPALIPPVYRALSSGLEEAAWTAYEIQHLMALPGLFKYSDIAILVRAAYQTRNIENELVRRHIPYQVVRGKAFWERKEVVSIVDYLRVVSNDFDRIAYLRTINYPKRGMGEKTIQDLDSLIRTSSLLAFDTLLSVAQSRTTSLLTQKMKSALNGYLGGISKAKESLASLEVSTGSCIDSESAAALFDLIYVESGLRAEFLKDENQQLNISEVKRQFCEYQEPQEELAVFIGGDESDAREDTKNILAKFVLSIGLYETDTEQKDEEEEKLGKVSISTIHAAKGLEWPVVFIPGLSEGLLPARFAMKTEDEESINEERRCFYVATTRAKHLLYMSSYIDSFGWGAAIEEESRFIAKLPNSMRPQDLQGAFKAWSSVQNLYKVRRIAPPKEDEFNLERFYKWYNMRRDAYLKGESIDVKTQCFKSFEADGGSIQQGIFLTARKLHDLEGTKRSFSAKLAPRKAAKREVFYGREKAEAGIVSLKDAVSKEPEMAKNLPTRQGQALIGSFFGHREPKKDTAKVKPGSTMKKEAKIASAFSGPNKAPPYIPVRKREVYVPKARR